MSDSTPPPRRMSGWDKAAIGAMGAVGGTLSYDALQQMAVAMHVRPELTYLFPVAIDGFIAYGVRALVVLKEAPLRARAYTWSVFGLSTATSVWANWTHAVRLNETSPVGRGLHLPDLSVGVLSTIAPLVLGGATHLYIVMSRHVSDPDPNESTPTEAQAPAWAGRSRWWHRRREHRRSVPGTAPHRDEPPDRVNEQGAGRASTATVSPATTVPGTQAAVPVPPSPADQASGTPTPTPTSTGTGTGGTVPAGTPTGTRATPKVGLAATVPSMTGTSSPPVPVPVATVPASATPAGTGTRRVPVPGGSGTVPASTTGPGTVPTASVPVPVPVATAAPVPPSGPDGGTGPLRRSSAPSPPASGAASAGHGAVATPPSPTVQPGPGSPAAPAAPSAGADRLHGTPAQVPVPTPAPASAGVRQAVHSTGNGQQSGTGDRDGDGTVPTAASAPVRASAEVPSSLPAGNRPRAGTEPDRSPRPARGPGTEPARRRELTDDELRALLPIGRSVAAKAAGGRLTRETLRAGLKARNVPINNTALGQLLRELKDIEGKPPPATPHH